MCWAFLCMALSCKLQSCFGDLPITFPAILIRLFLCSDCHTGLCKLNDKMFSTKLLNPSPVCVGWSQKRLDFLIKNSLWLAVLRMLSVFTLKVRVRLMNIYSYLKCSTCSTGWLWRVTGWRLLVPFGLVCITISFVLAMLKSASSWMVLSFRRRPTMAMSSTYLHRKQEWTAHDLVVSQHLKQAHPNGSHSSKLSEGSLLKKNKKNWKLKI